MKILLIGLLLINVAFAKNTEDDKPIPYDYSKFFYLKQDYPSQPQLYVPLDYPPQPLTIEDTAPSKTRSPDYYKMEQDAKKKESN